MSAAKKQSHLKKKRARRRSRPQPISPPAPSADELPTAVFTIPGFCKAHDLSISMFHKMRQLGIAPEIMCVGTRRMISVEAAARWRAERERSAA